LPILLALPALVLGIGLLPAGPASAQGHHGLARDLGHADPAVVGLSAERLERLDAGMQRMVDEGKLAGVVTMLARNGKIAFVDSVGVQDVESETPMAADSIFLIYSMTKPITAAALMILYEEGKWQIDEPVSNFIPELADLRVHAGEYADGSPVHEAATRSMTMRELLTHSGGLDYGFDNHPVARAYRDKGVLDADAPLQDMIDKLGKLPLRYQPGTRWHYSISVDVQGYLVEKLSGQPFDEFLLDRIFEPLGMVDTAFFVPAGDVDRAARIHQEGDEGLELADNEVRTLPPAGPSGGGGLYSTAGDYMRFMQMLLNGGELGGVRVLSPRSVEIMRTNHLLPGPLSTRPAGRGFSFGFEVVTDAAAAGEAYADGSYRWGGAAGTWFWIDPKTDLAFVGMIQHRGAAVGEVQSISRNFVYGALTR
jgi:CubicO group peptidase (beta-lactamase class C family)